MRVTAATCKPYSDGMGSNHLPKSSLSDLSKTSSRYYLGRQTSTGVIIGFGVVDLAEMKAGLALLRGSLMAVCSSRTSSAGRCSAKLPHR
jgi:hypothetical protein